MAYLVLGAFLLVALLLGSRAIMSADPATLARAVRIAGAAIASLVIAFLIYSGRFGFAMMLAIAAFSLLRRGGLVRNMMRMGGGGFTGFGGFPGFGGASPSPGQKSNVETEWLRMYLDHDSGDLDGEVLKGKFGGSRLSALRFEDLIDLLSELQHEHQSASLLESYLSRAHGPDWAERASESHGARQGEAGASANGRMTVAEAWEVLGLEAGASKDDIREAHRRLMKTYHPDRGGSSYLAAKINEAKDLLLSL